MNAFAPTPMPPFPSNPAVGQQFMGWVWNGSAWVCSGGGPIANLIVFAQSATYFPSPGLSFAIVEVIGGGGGGGAALASWTGSSTVAGWVVGGGGGASGGYSRMIVPAALVLGGIAVTVGAGGAGMTAFTQNTEAPNGGASSFGVLVVANGGNGGFSNVCGSTILLDPQIGAGGARTALGIGQLTSYGNGGGPGSTNYYDPTQGSSGQSIVWGGRGGDSFLGNMERAQVQAPGGTVGAFGYQGSGGGGGVSTHNTSGGAGGPGGAGLVYVTEFCFGNTNQVQDCGCQPTGNPCLPNSPGWVPQW
jgi:hypothetical protein